MNILIIDDNAGMRRLIRALVGDLAEAVYECEDGAEALNAYLQHRPDWVLMDIKMADVDGIAASSQIKAADPAAKIVIVTDYDDERLRAAARNAGAHEYVIKERLLDLRPILSGSAAAR
jgi:two-component system NarL family response regulator